jgi:hypothetical protein
LSPASARAALRTLHHKVAEELRGVAGVLQQRRDARRVALGARLRAQQRQRA